MNKPDTVNYEDSYISYNKSQTNENIPDSSDANQTIHTNNDKHTANRKSLSKGEHLFYTHKDNRSRREEIHKKAEIEREMKALENCTFSPVIHKFEKKDSDEILHKESYTDYVDRMRKYRSGKQMWEKKCDSRVGSGKIWRKSVTGFTVPDEFLTPQPDRKSRRRTSDFMSNNTTLEKFRFTDSCFSIESPNKINIKVSQNFDELDFFSRNFQFFF